MIHSVRYTAVLDTNVMVPIELRDILFWFAHFELFTPKWSLHIFDEWNAVMIKMGVHEDEREKRMDRATRAFPDALVHNYGHLIEALALPDPKDRHVLAAAIKTNANVIVTQNLKDFPSDVLANYGLFAKDVDDFLTDTIDLNPSLAIQAFRSLVLNSTNPDLDEYEILAVLRRYCLKDTADYLHALL